MKIQITQPITCSQRTFVIRVCIEINVNEATRRKSSSSVIKCAIAEEKRITTNPYDAKIKGGCIIIYGEIRSGFSPLPSRGGISFFMNGFMKS